MNLRDVHLRGAERLPPVPLRFSLGRHENLEPARVETANPASPWTQHLPEFVCSRTPISVLLSHDAGSVGPQTSVEWLTSFLLERGLSAVAVTSEGGALVGVVSITDLLREVHDRGDVEERKPLRMLEKSGLQVDLGDGFNGTCLARATVEEIMTPSTFTLPETASIARAASLMAFEGVSQLPVACSRCNGVCIVSALNVMSWLARESGFALSPPIEHAPIERYDGSRLR